MFAVTVGGDTKYWHTLEWALIDVAGRSLFQKDWTIEYKAVE